MQDALPATKSDAGRAAAPTAPPPASLILNPLAPPRELSGNRARPQHDVPGRVHELTPLCDAATLCPCTVCAMPFLLSYPGFGLQQVKSWRCAVCAALSTAVGQEFSAQPAACSGIVSVNTFT